ncbi:unnamed protein product [Closterium sp. NIES-53]
MCKAFCHISSIVDQSVAREQFHSEEPPAFDHVVLRGTRNVEKGAIADEGVALLDHGLDPERCIKTSKCLLICGGFVDGGGGGEEKDSSANHCADDEGDGGREEMEEKKLIVRVFREVRRERRRKRR